MKVKSFFLLILIFCMLTGCASNPSVDEPTDQSEQTTPELEPYTPPTNPERWYEGYMDHLIPGDDYGTLVPYIGGVRTFYEEVTEYPDGYYYAQPVYGLATADGKIVTDAVYTNVSYADGCYMLQSVGPDGTEQCFACTEDGSYVYDVVTDNGNISYIGSGIYILEYFDSNISEIFSMQGEKLAQIAGHVEPCGKERLRVYSPDHDFSNVMYDFGGNRISDYYEFFYGAGDYYIAEKSGGGNAGDWGILDNDGRVIIKVEHDDIIYADGTFVLRDGNTVTTLDENLNEIATFTSPDEVYIANAVSSDLVCLSTASGVSNYTVRGERIDIDYFLSYSEGFYTASLEKNGSYTSVYYDENLNELSRSPEGYHGTGMIVGGKYAILEKDIQMGDWYIFTYTPFDIYTGELGKEYDQIRYETIEKDGKKLPIVVNDNKTYLFGEDEVFYKGQCYGSVSSALGDLVLISDGCANVTLRSDGTPVITVYSFND